ncbi:hypothetical protein BC834DRAFT_892206, partial [Gloeopeniophorella convolvens]
MLVTGGRARSARVRVLPALTVPLTPSVSRAHSFQTRASPNKTLFIKESYLIQKPCIYVERTPHVCCELTTIYRPLPVLLHLPSPTQLPLLV